MEKSVGGVDSALLVGGVKEAGAEYRVGVDGREVGVRWRGVEEREEA